MNKILQNVALLVIAIVGSTLALTAQQPAQSAPAATQPGERAEQGDRPRAMRGTAGTITIITGDTIKLKTFDGRDATVKVNDKTSFRKDQKEAKAADFKPGDIIFVRGDSNADGSWEAKDITSRSDLSAALAGSTGGANARAMLAEGLGKEFIAGRVKEIKGTKLTIVRPDSQIQTIEVDENTSFRMVGGQANGESVTLADIKPGFSVMGRGALNKDGVFVPKMLNVSERRFDGPMMVPQP